MNKEKLEKKFDKVSGTAKEMLELIGGWDDVESMLNNFGSCAVREKICKLIGEGKKGGNICIHH